MEIEFGSREVLIAFVGIDFQRLLLLIRGSQGDFNYIFDLKEAIQLKDYLDKFIKEVTENERGSE